MKKNKKILSVVAPLMFTFSLAGCTGGNSATEGTAEEPVTLNIATVNNPDMETMQELSSSFEESHPHIKLNFIALPDNELRKKVTLDASTGSGQYDIATVGPYEVQSTWAKNEWLEPLGPLFEEYPEIEEKYELDDVIEPIAGALSYKDELYGLPFYGESNMLFYRKDLFEEKGLEMPEHPTWTQVEELAKQFHNPPQDFYGITLNGTPQYGQLAPLLTVINSFGGRWFDMDWKPQLTSTEFKNAVSFYTDLVKNYGAPGATNIGFNEGLGLMAQGKSAMWYHSTVAAGMLNDPESSKVVGKVGYAFAPTQETENGSHWLYTWGLGMISSSEHKKEAFEFMTWATSKEYIDLVAEKKGLGSIPSGTRYSTYENEEYLKIAPWATLTRESIETADINKPAKDEVPYSGLAQINIPEYAEFASEFGKNFASILTGKETVDEALEKSQKKTEEVMEKAGYYK
ncbi:ABC transporter substrate-binding protein [Domibacillus robiginosus]|uniref:ABC transporter substrate-binding protein n=1 Tax=Domibacillus robiginosus TaxID=1071054 RepID=UPI00067BEC1E|nr:sugar ABC transporter substrate-binding protein [Domibacillus robiginosus]